MKTLTLALTLALALAPAAWAERPGIEQTIETNVIKQTKAQCKGTTKAGARCKRTVGVGKAGFCYSHKAQTGGSK